MEIKKLERANKIQNRITEVTKAIKWLSSGDEIQLMANRQIGASISVESGMRNTLITEFTKELEDLNKEFAEL